MNDAGSLEISGNGFCRVARVQDVPEGKMIEVSVGTRNLVLCHACDGWFALDNLCTHGSAKLHEGRLRGRRLICPLHGGSFDCRTGAVLAPPALRPLGTYAVRISGGYVEIAIEVAGE